MVKKLTHLSIFSVIVLLVISGIFYACQSKQDQVLPATTKAEGSWSPPEHAIYTDSVTITGNIADTGWVKLETVMKMDGHILEDRYFYDTYETDSICFVGNGLGFNLLDSNNNNVVYYTDTTTGFMQIKGGSHMPAKFISYIKIPKDYHFDASPDKDGNFKIKKVKPGEACYPGGSKCPAEWCIDCPWLHWCRDVSYCLCFMLCDE